MDAVVQARTSKVSIKDCDCSLSEPGIGTARGLQQVLNDDPLAHFILDGEDHCLTAAQFLKVTQGNSDELHRLEHKQL